MKTRLQSRIARRALACGFIATLLTTPAVGQVKTIAGADDKQHMFVEAHEAIRFENRSRQKWGSPVIGDFDRDGQLDMLLNEHGHHTLLYWNEGGKFSEPVALTRRDKHGVGVGDLSHDGRLDFVISQGGGGGKKPRNPIHLEVSRDRTISSSKELDEFVRSRGRAIKFIDADNDGKPEILHTASPLKSQADKGANILYSREGSDSFSVASYLPRTPWMGFRAMVTDYDNDHDIDVMLFGGKNITVSKGADGATFTDATEEALGGLAQTTFVSSIAEIDYDNDGDFDLFLTRCDHPFDPEAYFDTEHNRYYFFTRQNKGFDLEEIAIDGDLRIENFQTAFPASDIFVGSSKRKLDLPGGKFGQKDFTLEPAVAKGWPDDTSAQGVYIGHLRDDKWRVRAETKAANSAVIHGVLSDLNGLPKEPLPARLFENRNGVFVDVTSRLGIAISEQTTSCAVGDFDNDGWSDLFIVRYGDPAMPNKQLLYLNDSGKRFVRVENHGLVSQELGATGAGAEAFDYDADGDLDLVYGNERGRWHLFTNTSQPSTDNHYLVVKVGRSPTGKASAQYATLTLKAGGQTFKRAVNGNSYGLNHSMNTHLHVGLGDIDQIDEATVRWSNGETEQLAIDSVNQAVAAGAVPVAAQQQPVANEKPRAETFTGDYESLKHYECPGWFRDAKFGIWSHWGPQCVPENSGWYARQMYLQDTLDFSGTVDAHKFHQENYGHQSEFGYKDLIPLFTAEKWDARKLMKLYKRAGAKYFVSMGQHHDNFDMWNSKLQPWNSFNMGPKRDIVKEWLDAARDEGLYFGVSFHGEPAWRWFEVSRLSDTSGPKKGVPYDGWLTKADGKGKWWEGYDPQDLYCRPHKPSQPVRAMWPMGDEIAEHGDQPDDAYMDKFVGRVQDVVDSYNPELIYFDIPGVPAGEDRGLEMIASFYNQSMQRHGGVNQGVVQAKRLTPKEQEMFMLDIEINRSAKIRKEPWQTDIGLDGWFYRKRDKPRHLSTTDVIHALIDIVSKNGNMLLNITQTADGEIQPYAYRFLDEMGDWMDVNATAIHGTRPWKVYGEGPSRNKGGLEKRYERVKYTSSDFRFTTKEGVLYAFLMSYPQRGGEVLIRSLSEAAGLWTGGVKEVELLGAQRPVSWELKGEGLRVQLPEKAPTDHACVIRISSRTP